MNFRRPTLAPFYPSRLLVLFSALGIPAMVAAAEPLLPCSDPNGCPDLIVDQNKLKHWKIQTTNFSADDCAVVEGETGGAGTRKLLRFTFTTPNLGPGALIVGDPNDHPELFDFVTCHGHVHYKEYADYRLWTLNGYINWQALRQANPGALASELLAANPAVAAEMISGAKRGFCVVDVVRYVRRAAPQQYTSCDFQGISVGWADEYGLQLDGQWVDITGLARGKYMLEAEVNAERVFKERVNGYSNNSAAVPVRIP
jgi:hypothetical protein